MARVTSISDIRYYKQCKMLWDFASEMRKSYRPARSPHYFMLGRAFHTAMESHYGKWSSGPIKAFERYMLESAKEEDIEFSDPMFLDMFEFGAELLTEYMLWADGNEFGFPFEVISTEEAHTLHLFDEVHYGFRTDLIIRDTKKNKLWLVDFKTTSVMPTENALSYLDNDEQATAYLHATEQVCNCSLAGIIFVFACTKRFQQPRILKNGQLSTNASQYTTERLFKQELSRLELDANDYFNIINILKSKNNIFKVSKVLRSNDEKKWFWNHNLIPTVREMAGDPLIYPSPSRMSCSMCSYKDPCMSAIDPRFDENNILNLEYVKSEPRYEVKEEVSGFEED